MVRPYLITGFLLAGATATQAQTAPTTPVPDASATTSAPAATPADLLPPSAVAHKYKDYLNKRYAGDKEALAAIHMFGRKQTGGALWLLGGASFLGYLASQTGTKTLSNGATVTTTVSPLGYVVFTVLPAGIAIGKFSRFSNGELYKVLLNYDKTHTFPGYVTAKLGRSDYQ